MQDIDDIMMPYDEDRLFSYNKDTDEFSEPSLYPQLRYDYYNCHKTPWYNKIEDCMVIIEPNGHAISRQYWNGKKWIDQNELFEAVCGLRKKYWKNCNLYELDIHW